MSKDLPQGFRKFPDGTLVAPRRGVSPPAPEGYEKSPWDSFVYLPILQPCEHREIKKQAKGCCERSNVMWCNYLDKMTTRGQCGSCKSSPEEYFSE